MQTEWFPFLCVIKCNCFILMIALREGVNWAFVKAHATALWMRLAREETCGLASSWGSEALTDPRPLCLGWASERKAAVSVHRTCVRLMYQ